MNIEELKLVLETIQSVAETAGWVGVVWVCIHYLVALASAIVWPVVVAVLGVVAARKLVEWKRTPQTVERVVKVGAFTINEETWTELKRVLLTKVSTTGVHVHASDVRRMEAALDAYKEKV
jgi:hypothetical protein